MRTTTSTEPVAIGLGSNLGDRESYLSRAIIGLEHTLGTLRVASLYENAALPFLGPESDLGVTPDSRLASGSQPAFLNTVVVAERPAFEDFHQLLTLAHELELAAGRRPAPRWAPRPLDVDILVVGKRISLEPGLTLPHPGLRYRRFVLVPLAEITPDLPIPPDGATAATLSAALAPESHPLERRDWRLSTR